TGPAVPYAQVADVVEGIGDAYLELRQRPDELFIDTVKRTGVEPFRERVHGARLRRPHRRRSLRARTGRHADPGSCPHHRIGEALPCRYGRADTPRWLARR